MSLLVFGETKMLKLAEYGTSFVWLYNILTDYMSKVIILHVTLSHDHLCAIYVALYLLAH